MNIAHCPHCGTAVPQLPELIGKQGRCPGCGQVFTMPPIVADPVAPPLRQIPLRQIPRRAPRSATHFNPKWIAVIGMLIVLVVCSAVGLTFFVADSRQNSKANSKSATKPSSVSIDSSSFGESHRTLSQSEHHSLQQAVRRWLKGNSNDPNSIEEVRWDFSLEEDYLEFYPGRLVALKYRFTNPLGGRSITTSIFAVKHGEPVRVLSDGVAQGFFLTWSETFGGRTTPVEKEIESIDAAMEKMAQDGLDSLNKLDKARKDR